MDILINNFKESDVMQQNQMKIPFKQPIITFCSSVNPYDLLELTKIHEQPTVGTNNESDFGKVRRIKLNCKIYQQDERFQRVRDLAKKDRENITLKQSNKELKYEEPKSYKQVEYELLKIAYNLFYDSYINDLEVSQKIQEQREPYMDDQISQERMMKQNQYTLKQLKAIFQLIRFNKLITKEMKVD